MPPKTTGPASGFGAAILLRLARTPPKRVRVITFGLLVAAAVLTAAEAVLTRIALPRIRAVDLAVDAAIARRLGQDATPHTLWSAPGPIVATDPARLIADADRYQVANRADLAYLWYPKAAAALALLNLLALGGAFVAAIAAAVGARLTRSPDPGRG